MPKLMNLPLLLTGGSAVTYETLSPVMDALTAQITVSNVVTFLGAVIGACVGFAFMWWGYGMAKGKLMKAFKKGKV